MSERRFLEIARVLSDPMRLDILSRIAQRGQLACMELTEALSIVPATISHHIKELRTADLVKSRREGKFFFYRLNHLRWREYLAELEKRIPAKRV